MIAEALKFLQDQFTAAKFPNQLIINSRTYVDKGLNPVENPRPDTAEVHTLTAIVDLLAVKVGRLVPGDVHLRVEGPTKVRLCSTSVDEWGNRQFYASSEVSPPSFKYGEYVDHESFMIALQANFKPTPDRDYLLSVASSLTNEVVAQAEDNGIAQRVALRSGSARTSKPP